MVYVIQNRDNFSITRIQFVPYLHERKLYLNRMKLNTSYFYTSIEIPVKEKDLSSLNSSEQEDVNSDERTLTGIVSVNISENKFYIYS